MTAMTFIARTRSKLKNLSWRGIWENRCPENFKKYWQSYLKSMQNLWNLFMKKLNFSKRQDPRQHILFPGSPEDSTSNIPRTFPKNPFWPSQDVLIWYRGDVLSWCPGDVLNHPPRNVSWKTFSGRSLEDMQRASSRDDVWVVC